MQDPNNEANIVTAIDDYFALRSEAKYFSKNDSITAALLVLAIILSFVFGAEGLGAALIFFGFFGLIIWLVAKWYKTDKRFKEKLALMSAENGYEYKRSVRFKNFKSDIISNYPPSVFLSDVGDSKSVSEYFSFKDSEGDRVAITEYTYQTGSGKSRQTHYWTILSVSLPAYFPQIVLDSRKNDGIISSLPLAYSAEQRIELEGDFNDSFDLYAPDGYGIEVLDVMSPDFMVKMMKSAAVYDVEIFGNSLHLTMRHRVFSQQQKMKEITQAALELQSWIKQKSKTWSFTVQERNVPTLKFHSGESMMRIGNLRITSAFLFIPAIAIFIGVRVGLEAGSVKLAVIITLIVLIISAGYRVFFSKGRRAKWTRPK